MRKKMRRHEAIDKRAYDPNLIAATYQARDIEENQWEEEYP